MGGAPEAGAIFVKIERRDGSIALFGPAPLGINETGERIFMRLHTDEWTDVIAAEARLQREISYDPDVWIVEVEDRKGRSFLDVVR